MECLNAELEFIRTFPGNLNGYNDFEWFPWMNGAEDSSCCFVSVSKDLPIQMWSTRTGQLRSSWTAKDHLDQVSTCNSVSISPDGRYVVGGGQARLWCFDITRPGSESLIPTSTISSKKANDGQSGIISNISFRKDSTNVLAAASFDGFLGVYDLRANRGSFESKVESCVLFKAHKYGASQSAFLSDGWSLVSTGRRDGLVHIWDLRMPGEGPRRTFSTESCSTNQRIYFDVTRDDQIFIGSGKQIQKLKSEAFEVVHQGIATVSSVSISNCGIVFTQGSREEDPSTFKVDRINFEYN